MNGNDGPERWLGCHKGVASVVTGGGKTIFAFLCMANFRRECEDGRFIILVPTITLLDQWYVSLQEDFGVSKRTSPASPVRKNPPIPPR